MRSKKTIAIFGYKQRILSIEMQTKIVKHFLVHSPEEHVVLHLVGLVLLVVLAALLAVHDLVDELLVFGYHRVLGVQVLVDGRTFLACSTSSSTCFSISRNQHGREAESMSLSSFLLATCRSSTCSYSLAFFPSFFIIFSSSSLILKPVVLALLAAGELVSSSLLHPQSRHLLGKQNVLLTFCTPDVG